jgi:hypothetical protein
LSLYDVLDQLGFITRELAIVGLFVTAALIVLVDDWRASLLALLGQYILAGLVLSRLALPEVAYSAAAQRAIFPAGPAFRLLAVTLMGLLAMALSQSYPLPLIPPDVGLASYWLMLNGLLILMLTEHPFKAAQGLLTGITGFELLYTSIERSLAIVWLWAIVNLLLTLAIAYLVVARNGDPSEGNS